MVPSRSLLRLACHVAVQARADAQGIISKQNFKVFLLKAANEALFFVFFLCFFGGLGCGCGC